MKKLVFALFVMFLSNIFAHVGLRSPLGSEQFTVGESVNISWQIIQIHPQNNWDLYFSSDGGNTWEDLAADLPTTQLEYSWTVPNNITTTARIRVVQDNTEQNYEAESDDFSISVTTDIEDISELAQGYKIFQNYPNPFNPTTVISYSLPTAGIIELSVFSSIGEKVITLVSGQQNSGNHSITWNGKNQNGYVLPSGMYYYSMTFKNFTQTRKMLLIK